ncbi:MAG TPA: HAD-IIB family hydrolase [Acidobacteriota bacterium]|nr:HAD-IIB family hydrolase [Acidobacteriota bacterium]HQF86051.1 HAD-IIB family hydrolase [Acidobacteriota bacterium]HQG90706.1 HAD-IIB family hydrolase [Acidobacteriota bacterium]HQK86027.1 HAD-IIB family hydrolase [Acidobacteriota bacterium]
MHDTATQWVVFTDLDGTLLDKQTYSWSAARSGLELLAGRSIPLVLVTSKTLAEVEPLRRDMQLNDPFIVENGAAVFLPPDGGGPEVADLSEVAGYRCRLFGRTYAEARRFLVSQAARLGARGFGDMTIDEISARTALPPDAAGRAAARLFTEPCAVEPGRLAELDAIARRAGFRILEGGRFCHVVAAGQDKGTAVRWLIAAYQRRWPGRKIGTVGIGDSPNDLDFLSVVDVPVLVRRPDGTHLRADGLPRALLAAAIGPAGWNLAIHQLLGDRR